MDIRAVGDARRATRRWLSLVVLLTLLAACPACVRIPKRLDGPGPEYRKAVIPGGAEFRYWGDELPPQVQRWSDATPEEIAERYPGIVGAPHAYLAISGGAGDGAFGAGLLKGWTAAGDRPEFTIVTGVSTGALIAPFAFLGSAFDEKLEVLYTTTSTKDILKKRWKLALFFRDALASSKPLESLLESYIDEDIRRAIASEHSKGRRLLIGTTNLDARRPVVWDLGAIASSSHPEALNLMRKVLLASASVPGGFPPVLVKVDVEGQAYEELHVDGGVTHQVFLFPVGLEWQRAEAKFNVPGKPTVYVIRNARIDPRWDQVKNRFIPIALESVLTLARTQGVGDLYRIYFRAQRNGMLFRMVSIPSTFKKQAEEEFDKEYMKELFEVGVKMAAEGVPWQTEPPLSLSN